MPDPNVTCNPNILERLPGKYHIEIQDYNKFWRSFTEEFREQSQTNDLLGIKKLSKSIFLIPTPLLLPPSEEVLADLIPILFDVATTCPVKSAGIQVMVFFVIYDIFKLNPPSIPKLTLDWHKLYQFLRDLLFKGSLSIMSRFGNGSSNLFSAISFLSNFFPSGSASEMVKRFIPKVSTRGIHSSYLLTFLSHMIPVHHHDHHLWLKYFVQEMLDASHEERLASIFYLVRRVIYHNPLDDFSYLLPYIFDFVTTMVINFQPVEYYGVEEIHPYVDAAHTAESVTTQLAHIICALFFAPKTREATSTKLASLLWNATTNCHPSSSSSLSPAFQDFIQNLVSFFSHRVIDGKIPDLPIEMLPSPAEYELFFKPIADCIITFIHTFTDVNLPNLLSPVQVIVKFCPSSLERFFHYANQCICMNDAEDVASQGWTVLTAILPSFEKTQQFNLYYHKIFEIAVSQLFQVELQRPIISFLLILFCYRPLNRKTNKLNEPYEEMAKEFIIALFDAARSFPASEGKLATIEDSLNAEALWTLRVFFFGAEKSVINSLLPVLINAIGDQSLSHSIYFISGIFSLFSITADESQVKSLLEILRNSISKCRYIPFLRYQMYTYAFLIKYFIKTEKEMECSLKPLIELTLHSQRKIRKTAWRAVSLSLFRDMFPMIVPSEGDLTADISSLSCSVLEPSFSDLAFRLFSPIFNDLMESSDVTHVYEVLKTTDFAIQMAAMFSPTLIEDSSNSLNRSMQFTPVIHKEFYATTALTQRIVEVSVRLMKDFFDTPHIFQKARQIFSSLFSSPILDQRLPNKTSSSLYRKVLGITKDQRVFNRFHHYLEVNSYSNLIVNNFYTPETEAIRKGMKLILESGLSRYKNLRDDSFGFLENTFELHSDTYASFIPEVFKSVDEIPPDELIDFLSFPSVFSLIYSNVETLCPVLYRLCSNLDIVDQESCLLLIRQLSEMMWLPFSDAVTSEKCPPFEDLLRKLEILIEENTRTDRTFHETVTSIIIISLRYLKEISPFLIQYLISQVVSSDQATQFAAFTGIHLYMSRKLKKSIIRHELFVKPRLDEFPKIIDNVSSEKFNTPEEYFEAVDFSSSVKEYTTAFDLQSAGWYEYADHYNEYSVEFADDPPIKELAANLIVCEMNRSDETDQEATSILDPFFAFASKYIGPQILDSISPLIHNIMEGEINEQIATVIQQSIGGILRSVRFWPYDSIVRLQKDIVIPFICIASGNPAFHQQVLEITLMMTIMNDPMRFKPILNAIFKSASSEPDAPVWRRTMLSILSCAILNRSSNFATSIDPIYEKILKPFLSNIVEYPSIVSNEIITIFFSIIEGICLNDDSPLSSKIIDNKREWLLEEFNLAIQKSDPSQKSVQQILLVTMENITQLPLRVITKILPMVFSVTNRLFECLEFCDPTLEEGLLSSITFIMSHQIFCTSSELGSRWIEFIISKMESLPAPMKQQILRRMNKFLRGHIYVFERKDLQKLYEIFSKIAKSTDNENVLIVACRLCGFTMRRLKIDPNGMEEMESLSALLTASVFDEPDPLVNQAFSIISEIIDKSQFVIPHRIQNVVRHFWLKHSDHLLPSVEEGLSKYRTLIPPSYIT